RQKSAGRPGRCKTFELFIARDSLTVLVPIDEFPQSEPHRYFVHARTFDISGNREIAATFPAICALLSVDFTAVQTDEWNPGECFNIANHRRQVLQPIRL